MLYLSPDIDHSCILSIQHHNCCFNYYIAKYALLFTGAHLLLYYTKLHLNSDHQLVTIEHLNFIKM